MLKHKSKEWLKRYLPSEIIGTITALMAASIAHYYYKNHVLIAYCGSVGEAIGFYSTVFIQNIFTVEHKKTTDTKSISVVGFIKVITNIALEYGPAALIDGLMIRPFFMYIFPLHINNFMMGIFLGKIAADIAFYFLVIVSYELRKHYKQKSVKS